MNLHAVRRLSLFAGVVWAVLIAVALSPTLSGAAQESGTFLFIESATFQPGEAASTAIILRTGDSSTVRRFSLSVSYPESFVRPTEVRLDPEWISDGDVELQAGENLAIGGSSPVGCGPQRSCRLALIDWAGLEAGTGSVHVSQAKFSDGNDDVTVSVTDGGVTITESLSQVDPISADGLGAPAGVRILIWVMLAGFGLGGPIVWLVFRLKRASRASVPVPFQIRGSRPESPFSDDLTLSVLNYLSAYEAGAQVAAEPDAIYDQMAKQASRTLPTSTPDRLAVDR